MINLLDILFSTSMVVLILVRAAMLNRQRPWFGEPQPTEPISKSRPIGQRKPAKHPR